MANRFTSYVVEISYLDKLAARVCMWLFIPAATIGLTVAVCEMTQAILRFFSSL